MDLCQYRNIFGEPGTGAHSYRIANIAVIDVAFTVILALFFKNPLQVFVLLMLLSIVVHKAFCVKTKLTNLVYKTPE